MSNFNILVIEDQEGLDSKSTSYRVAQTTSSDDKTNSKEPYYYYNVHTNTHTSHANVETNGASLENT